MFTFIRDLFRNEEERLRNLAQKLSAKDVDTLRDSDLEKWAILMDQIKGKFLREVLSLEMWERNPQVGIRLLAAVPVAIRKEHADHLTHLKSQLDQVILKQRKPKSPF